MFRTPERNRARQRGFAHIPLLIAVALGAVLVAAFVAGSRSSSDSAADKAAKANASAVIQTGQNLKAAVDQLLIEGYSPDDIEFNNCGPTPGDCSSGGSIGLWDPARGTAVEPTYPQNAVDTSTTQGWGMDADVILQDVGTGSAEHIAVLDQVSTQVCQQINAILHGEPQIPGTSSNAVSGGFNHEEDPTAGSGTDLTTAPTSADYGGISGWRMGCVVDDSDVNWFFSALNEG